MSPEDVGNRLSRIQTVWTLVFRANRGKEDPAVAAQQQLLRYRGAVYRYLPYPCLTDVVEMLPLYEDPWFTFRFAEARIIPADSGDSPGRLGARPTVK
jgi:hypothetical protein